MYFFPAELVSESTCQAKEACSPTKSMCTIVSSTILTSSTGNEMSVCPQSFSLLNRSPLPGYSPLKYSRFLITKNIPHSMKTQNAGQQISAKYAKYIFSFVSHRIGFKINVPSKRNIAHQLSPSAPLLFSTMLSSSAGKEMSVSKRPFLLLNRLLLLCYCQERKERYDLVSF